MPDPIPAAAPDDPDDDDAPRTCDVSWTTDGHLIILGAGHDRDVVLAIDHHPRVHLTPAEAGRLARSLAAFADLALALAVQDPLPPHLRPGGPSPPLDEDNA